LYLVGDGDDPSDRDVIMEKVNKLGLQDSVIITGFLPREEAISYIERADVCVSPFYPTPILNSTSPTKLVEYMAMGKPVVANDHPEQRQIIEESRAGLCVPYDEQEFASAIIKILEDKATAREMGERGRRYVESERSYDRIAEDVERQYYELCLR
jgi:glycosyltransferase involved in cell wall biosynthesis